jgi:rare lipoprotein A
MTDCVYPRGDNSLRKRFALVLVAAGMVGGCSTYSPPYSGVKPKTVLKSAPPSSDNNNKTKYTRPYKINGIAYFPMQSAEGYRERGKASWYGSESGRRTATGSRFRPNGFTAAHKTLPLPCRVKVTNLHNDRSVVVLVNDRGPFVKNRLIDLSRGAAKALGINGVADVEVEYLENTASYED